VFNLGGYTAQTQLLRNNSLRVSGFQSRKRKELPILTGGSVARALLPFPPPANPTSVLADIVESGKLRYKVSLTPRLVSLGHLRRGQHIRIDAYLNTLSTLLSLTFTFLYDMRIGGVSILLARMPIIRGTFVTCAFQPEADFSRIVELDFAENSQLYCDCRLRARKQ
jgi:hypothetical protein